MNRPLNKIIPGGYYLKARCIKNSGISNAPPYVRELWDYLYGQANHVDKKYDGFIVKRGQIFTSYRDIRESLCWYIGYRKMMYNENHMKKGMRHLTKELMITKEKKPRGVLITICNYDYYQNPKNYERTDKITTERTMKEPMENQGGTSINKNDKNVKNGKKENKERPRTFSPPTQTEVLSYFKEKGYTEDAAKRAYEYYNIAGWRDSQGKAVKNWKQKMLAVWFKDENKDMKGKESWMITEEDL